MSSNSKAYSLFKIRTWRTSSSLASSYSRNSYFALASSPCKTPAAKGSSRASKAAAWRANLSLYFSNVSTPGRYFLKTELAIRPALPGKSVKVPDSGVPRPDPGLAAPVATPLPGLLSANSGGTSAAPVAPASAAGCALGALNCVAGSSRTTSALTSSMDHSAPYSSSIVDFHKALSWAVLVVDPSTATRGLRPRSRRHTCQSFQPIKAGLGTSPSLTASSNVFALWLTCAISGTSARAGGRLCARRAQLRRLRSRSSPQLRCSR